MHSHVARSANELQKENLSNVVKRKAVKDICERPSKILHCTLLEENIDCDLASGDVQRIRKNVYHAGTFKSVPTLFTHLFIVHSLQNSTYVPLVFCLLPDKKKESYTTALKHILHACNGLGLFLAPALVYADFQSNIQADLLVVSSGLR